MKLIGDVPIYVAPGSADHRAHPELFQDGAVAGTPPDAFTDKGQLWGNPLYDWPALQRRGYRWWIERLRRTFDLYDLARVDHFRGFVSYWSVPARARHALSGHWKRGPGRAVFDAAAAELGELALIAEDLGVITPAVERLRDGLGYPGMAILQYHFDPDPHSPAQPRQPPRAPGRLHGHPRPRHAARLVRVAARRPPRAGRRRRSGAGDDPHWRLIELAFSSRAEVAMVQTQDVLGLGSEARMNMPGTAEGLVEVAPARRRADPRPRPPPPCGERGRGPRLAGAAHRRSAGRGRRRRALDDAALAPGVEPARRALRRAEHEPVGAGLELRHADARDEVAAVGAQPTPARTALTVARPFWKWK